MQTWAAAAHLTGEACRAVACQLKGPQQAPCRIRSSFSHCNSQDLLQLALMTLVNQRPAISKLCCSRQCPDMAEARLCCSQRMHSVNDCSASIAETGDAQTCWSYTSVHTARDRALLHQAHGSLASMVNPPAGSGAVSGWQGASMPIQRAAVFISLCQCGCPPAESVAAARWPGECQRGHLSSACCSAAAAQAA